MLSEALAKLKAEMDGKKNNTYIQVVGGFLQQHLERFSQDAEKVLNQEKTIAKSLDEMRKEASKKKDGNCAVLTDQEGFEIVLKYFGINGNPASIANNAPAPAEQIKQSPSFDVKLEDLLL